MYSPELSSWTSWWFETLVLVLQCPECTAAIAVFCLCAPLCHHVKSHYKKNIKTENLELTVYS